MKKNTQKDFVCGELGKMSLQVQRYYTVIKFVLKILQTGSKKYVKIVYNMLYQGFIDRWNVRTWCSLLKDLLFTVGFPDV